MFENEKRWGSVRFLFTAMLVLLVVVPGFGDSEEDAAATGVTQGESSGAPGHLSKLSVHGFLTQAWAIADFVDVPIGTLPNGTTGPLGPSPDQFEVFLGIPEGGTTNYRDFALQFRYDMSDEDVFVVQLSSRTIGTSPLQVLEDDVALDWAFYERRLSDNTSLKVGRVQIPFGIYNETRDVGTVLPFYRPPVVFYKEGAFTSETVDGLSLSHTFFADSDWNLELTGYAGEWEAGALVPGEEEVSSLRARDAYGYQLWLVSPWNVRLGTGLVSFVQEGGSFLEPINGRRDILHVSLDAKFGRFTIQAEWNEEDGPRIATPIGVVGLHFSEWYALAGLDITEKLRIFVQSETAFLRGTAAISLGTSGRKQREDTAIAVNYAFTPSIVFKAEYHSTVSRGSNNFPDFSTGELRLRSEIYEADDGSYSIISLAVSF